MKSSIPCLLLIGLLASPSSGFAQRRASANSPRIHPDQTVTFQLQAPAAREVKVNGQWRNGSSPLTKDENGIWSVTVGPVEPGVWEYSFQVDGLSMIDPENSWIKPMRAPRTSILHVSGTPPRIHDFREVPHGTVRSHAYFSQSLERLRHLSVYTPPGYDQNTRTYPVLHLQHGSGDNQDTWTVHGKAHWILDNLIAEGKAVPMIIVMMDGHAQLPRGRENTEYFERDLLRDVMPFVAAHYRVKPGAENRAIIGLSMGGGQSLTIGLNHTDQFAWVGGFSASVPQEAAAGQALQDAAATNDRLKLLWIACGKDDFLLDRNLTFIELLKQKDIGHEWHLTEGNHSWPVWRGYLADVLPRLFQ